MQTTSMALNGRTGLPEIVIASFALVSRLPSVLESILLQRSSKSEGNRYTLTKLTTYVLVAIVSLLASNTIGATHRSETLRP